MHNIRTRSFEKMFKGKNPIFLKLALASLGLMLINPRFAGPNSRRNRRNHRYLKELKNLNKISLEITSQLEIKELLPIIAKHSATLANGDGGFISILDKDTNEIIIAASYKNKIPIGMRFELSELPEARLLLHGEHLVLDRDDPRLSTQFKNFMQLTEVESALYSPLMYAGELIGIVCAGSTKKYMLTRRQIEIIRGISDQAAIAIQNANLYTQTKTELERERHITEELQRSLLPNEIPDISNSDLGTYYASSTKDAQVGGDFYDLIALPDKKYAIMIGDVSGKGVAAAASTAMVKYIIRTFLYQNASPAYALSQANTAISKQLETGTFVTVFCAVYDAKTGHLTYANAGHPSPYYFDKESGLCSELIEADPALTLLLNYNYQENRILLTPQSFIAAFTDGTFEAKHNHEFFGEERLHKVIQQSANLPAQGIADNIAEACLNFSCNKLADDIAIFVLKRT